MTGEARAARHDEAMRMLRAMSYGTRVEVRGCDLWTLREGKVVKKDSYWKIRTP